MPAYLVNLILALDPLPEGELRADAPASCRRSATASSTSTSQLIANKFPDPKSDFVYERFDENWNPDHG